jgi:DNA end-binding protein Ku
MARAIWSGAISFGLVNIPIKLVTAVDRKNVSFREIRRSDSSRIRHRKVAANDGQEVSSDQIVKGFEVAPDRYVVIDPEELRALDPKSTKTIEIEDFVELADIDPIYYDSSYYLVPAQTAAKPYELLRRSMLETGKAAIARFVLRTKQYLVVIRPLDGALTVSTLVYHDEVVQPAAPKAFPKRTSRCPTARSRWPPS